MTPQWHRDLWRLWLYRHGLPIESTIAVARVAVLTLIAGVLGAYLWPVFVQ